jgi:hypothetical protein
MNQKKRIKQLKGMNEHEVNETECDKEMKK